MNRDDWQKVVDKAGGTIHAAAHAIGIQPGMLSAYAHGIRPTPRKVALACAAYLRGIKPMGEK